MDARRFAVPLVLVALGGLLAAAPAGLRAAEAPGDWQSPVARDHPLVGRVWDVAAGAPAEPRGVVEHLAQTRFVVLGERHGNADHHHLQAWVLRQLVAAGRRPAVGFEMLRADDAPALAGYLATHRDAAGLGAAVGWEAAGWPPWPLYAPIAQAALDAGLPIVATDLPTDARRALRTGGRAALDPALAARLALDRPLAGAVRQALAAELRAAHCDVPMGEDTVERMIDIQRARDAHMAASLGAAGEADGAVLIAGAGHGRRDWGVPAHLAVLAPEATVAAVAFVEVDPAVTDPARYRVAAPGAAAPFDYLWFTPRVDAEDPCEKFRRALERVR
jgi:uncharacterized iron-regulated protein